MRYTLDFGTLNAGGSPTWTLYDRIDVTPPVAVVPTPTIVEIGSGVYYFDVDWTTVTATSITFVASLNGADLVGTINSDATTTGSVSASAGTSSTTGVKTSKFIVNQAAVELGILNGPMSSLGDPFASTDPNVQQLIAFVNYLGDDLNNRFDWPQFVKECTITTAGSASSYALPADFHEMLDQTGWNRSTRLPMIGPVSGQETQCLKAWMNNLLINVAFRLEGGLIVFPVVPGNGATLVFEYVSSYWVQTASSSSPDTDSITSQTDIVLYDPGMMVVGTKLLWSEAKGFDTSVLRERFEAKVEHAIGKAYGGRMLTLGGSGLNADRLLDLNNVPVTGLGQ